jgi:hypothetical protein
MWRVALSTVVVCSVVACSRGISESDVRDAVRGAKVSSVFCTNYPAKGSVTGLLHVLAEEGYISIAEGQANWSLRQPALAAIANKTWFPQTGVPGECYDVTLANLEPSRVADVDSSARFVEVQTALQLTDIGHRLLTLPSRDWGYVRLYTATQLIRFAPDDALHVPAQDVFPPKSTIALRVFVDHRTGNGRVADFLSTRQREACHAAGDKPGCKDRALIDNLNAVGLPVVGGNR